MHQKCTIVLRSGTHPFASAIKNAQGRKPIVDHATQIIRVISDMNVSCAKKQSKNVPSFRNLGVYPCNVRPGSKLKNSKYAAENACNPFRSELDSVDAEALMGLNHHASNRAITERNYRRLTKNEKMRND